MIDLKTPTVFISYAHTSEEHKERVLRLAERLYGDRITAIIDRYHLREGDDVNVFMEQMTTNPDIDFVVVISDRGYAEKVDQRAGSAGIEGAILSTVVYQQLAGGPNKVITVVFERNERGEPYLPAMLQGTFLIDMSTEDLYHQNWQQLVRTLYRKPALVPPPLGEVPRYITDPHYQPLPTESKSQAYLEGIKRASPTVVGLARDYLDALTASIRNMPLAVREEAGQFKYDSGVMFTALEGFEPIFDQYLQVLHESIRYGSTSLLDNLPHFFQSLLVLPTEVCRARNFNPPVAEHLTVLRHMLLVCTTAMLIKENQLHHLDVLLNHNYLHEQEIQYFTSMKADSRHFPEAYANHRGQRYLNPLGAFVVHYLTTTIVTRLDLFQADAVLYLKSLKRKMNQPVMLWHVSTWPYWQECKYPFPVFAAFASRRTLSNWGPVLEFVEMDQFITWAQENLRKHNLGYEPLSMVPLVAITAVDQWATRM